MRPSGFSQLLNVYIMLHSRSSSVLRVRKARNPLILEAYSPLRSAAVLTMLEMGNEAVGSCVVTNSERRVRQRRNKVVRSIPD